MIGSPLKRDYYEVLGVDRSATQEQLKQAYHQLAHAAARSRQRYARLHGRGKGDLYVGAEVTIPTALTPRQRELLREISMESNNTIAATGS